MSEQSLMVVFLLSTPLVGALLCLIISNHQPKLLSNVAFFSSILTLLISLALLWTHKGTAFSTLKWHWFALGNHPLEISFEFNELTLPLLMIVSCISFLVHVYSIDFFKDDKSRSRYFSTLGLFIFSLMGLTLSGNLFQLFIFWELVGLC